MWVVDQIQEGVVCLECIKTKNLKYVKQNEMPKDIAVGSSLELVGGKWKINKDETKARKDRIANLFNKIKKG